MRVNGPVRILGGVCVAAALLAAPAVATAAPPTTPQLIDRAAREQRIDRDTAALYLAYALRRPQKLPRAYRAQTPWDGTLPLLRLREAIPRMRAGPRRAEAEALVAGGCSGKNGALALSTESTHFYVEYSGVGGGLTIADYTASLEEAWTTQVDAFDWAAPPVAPTPAPNSKYHVRVEALDNGLYGFVSSVGTYAGEVGDNPDTPTWNEGDAFATCMVVQNDFTGFPSSPQASLDATTAHELNHSIQFGYGALDNGPSMPDLVFIEGGATWMEDEVQDAANDNRFYLWPLFAESMGDYDSSPYEYWIAFRGMTERYGTGIASGGEQVMQDFWEHTSKNTASNLTALQAALVTRGTTLANAFHAYAVAVKFNRACGGGYVAPHCLEEGPGYVSIAGATPVDRTLSAVGATTTNTALEDNYALNWVALPATGAAYNVHLDNRSNGGQLRATVACDTGSQIHVTPFSDVADARELVTLPGYTRPAGCVTPVAVVTNQAQTDANPTTSASRNYRLSTSASGVAQHPLTVGVAGSGTVTSNPAGISCGADCTESYAAGTTVTLTATPTAGWSFAGWSGEGCAGTGPCEVTMSVARNVTATFAEVPPPPASPPPATTSTAPPSTGGGVFTVADVVRPVFGTLRLTRTRFRAAAGTTVRYSLSEAARVAFRVERARPGRRVRRRCVRPTATNRRRARCVRWLRVRGSFAQEGRPGANLRRLPTRFAGRRLAPGRYRLVIAATDPAGNRSPARRVGFTILR